MRGTRAPRCARCLFPTAFCLCADLPTLRTRTRFVLLRHASEVVRSSNSGRWAALALANAELIDWRPGEPLDETPFSAPDTWVLFPTPRPSSQPFPLPRRIVVVDGTWKQARKMVNRVPVLRTLPRLSVADAPGPRSRLRRPTVPGGMSTLEAMAGALELLGEHEAASGLDRLYAAALEHVARMRGMPEPC